MLIISIVIFIDISHFSTFLTIHYEREITVALDNLVDKCITWQNVFIYIEKNIWVKMTD